MVPADTGTPTGKEQGLVSVVIPTCNRPDFLRQALRSVLAQTYMNLEVIVVDNCSTPEARPVAEGFDDARVRCLRNERRLGGGATRNRGIKAAKGRYVALLDNDDMWLPTKLERQWALLDCMPPEVGVVYCGNYMIDHEGKIYRVAEPEMRGDVREYLWSGRCGSITSSAVIRKALLEQIGGYDETLSSFQDYDLWLRLAPLCRFDYVREPLVKVRRHLGKKVSVDVATRLRGFEQFACKWRDKVPGNCGMQRMFRDGRAGVYEGAAEASILAGDWVSGLRGFLTAVRMAPRTPRLYLRLFSALGGPAVYKAALQTFRRLRAIVRRRGEAGSW